MSRLTRSFTIFIAVLLAGVISARSDQASAETTGVVAGSGVVPNADDSFWTFLVETANASGTLIVRDTWLGGEANITGNVNSVNYNLNAATINATCRQQNSASGPCTMALVDKGVLGQDSVSFTFGSYSRSGKLAEGDVTVRGTSGLGSDVTVVCRTSVDAYPIDEDRQPNRVRLRHLAKPRDIQIGSMTQYSTLLEPVYRTTLARDFNVATLDRSTIGWGAVHPEDGVWRFCQSEQIVQFALAHEMKVRGNLLQPEDLPHWVKATLDDPQTTRQDAIDLLEDHVKTVMGHFQGRVTQWAVLLEVIKLPNGERDLFREKIGYPDYVELAYQFAREADPTAELIYDDFTTEWAGPDQDAAAALVQTLAQQGLVDTVGLMLTDRYPSSSPPDAALRASITRFQNLGVKVAITQMDVPIDGWLLAQSTMGSQLNNQATVFRHALDACLDLGCNQFSVWGVCDLGVDSVDAETTDSNGTMPEAQIKPTLFSEGCRPKAASDRVAERLAE